MNKKLVVISAAIVAVLATGTVVAAAQSIGTIGKAKAKEEALRAVDGVVEEIDQEVKRGRMIYEVEVQKPGHDDDTTVIIDAQSGELIGVYEDDAPRVTNKVIEKSASQAAVPTQSSGASVPAVDTVVEKQNKTIDNSSSTKEKSTLLTMKQAKEIALRAVTGTIVDADLDRDDGVTKYEFEIRTDQGKVELDIDAYTGKVLLQKLDRDDDWNDDDDWDDDDHYDDDRYDDDRYDDDRYDD